VVKIKSGVGEGRSDSKDNNDTRFVPLTEPKRLALPTKSCEI
jgi:hypothetical protein